MIEKFANPEMLNEISKSASSKKFDVDKRLGTSKETGAIKETFDPDKRLKPENGKDPDAPQFSDGPIGKLEEMLYTKVTEAIDAVYDEFKRHEEIFPPEKKLHTKLVDRINQTPNSNGEWTEERGNSKFLSDDKAVNKELSKYGVDGIEYERGIVDFSPVAEDSVKISNMTDKRRVKGGNFEQADTAFAKKWNEEYKDGRSDWTPRDVDKYIEKNHLVRHECSDMKTVQLVPRKVHEFFSHCGGVAEYKAKLREDKKEVFDK